MSDQQTQKDLGKSAAYSARLGAIVIGTPLLALVWLYQAMISPFLGANCRHLPTCSEYAKDAVKLHGPLRGSWYALKRIGRCHPWAQASHDPVPPVHSKPMVGDGPTGGKKPEVGKNL